MTPPIAADLSRLKRLAMLPPAAREEMLARYAERSGLSLEKMAARLRSEWEWVGRPKQQAPPGDWTYWLILAGRGFGKLLDVETPIPTPDGWKRLGDVEVGDAVFDESGRACSVVATFDGEPDVAYRLRFSDGSTLDACGDHQWVTWDQAARKAYLRSPYEDPGEIPPDWPAWRLRRLHGVSLRREVVEGALRLARAGRRSARSIARELGVSRQALAPHLRAGRYVAREPRTYPDSPGPEIRTTQQIIDTFRRGRRGDANHSIPVAGPLDLPSRDLPLDPYVLGAWLGDGSAIAGSLTADPGDHEHWYRELSAFSPHRVGDPKTVATYGLYARLRAAGVLRDKHVPAAYLRASTAQRLALLQGLMDTDGSAVASGVEFSNTNERLVAAVTELARSLGQKPVVAEGRARLYGRDCGPKWRVTWRPTVPVFRLERKLRRLRELGSQASRSRHRMIVGWERIPPRPMRCLTVDSRHSMFLAGDAMIPTHNTRSGAEWALRKARELPGSRGALVAPTLGDGRTMVEGESGLLSILPASELRGGTRETAWNQTRLELHLANETFMKVFSSEKPDRLRAGGNTHWAWCDEVSSWKDAQKGDALDTTWSNLKLGCRLGESPQFCLTTTPKANKLTKAILGAGSALVVAKGSSYENRDNLSEAWWRTVVAPLEGTRTGRQEIMAELLEDVEGALWTIGQLDALRLAGHPELARVVVAVDPNVSSDEAANDAGIIVAGRGAAPAESIRAANGIRGQHAYVLDDRTVTRGGPRAWARAAVEAYHEHDADRIVAEKNNGGEMVALTIKTVDPDVPVKLVSASRGKRTRAEPVSALYEGDPASESPPRAHHVGAFPELEDEMTTYVPDPSMESPNRMDALVWALTDLMLSPGQGQMRARGTARRIPTIDERIHAGAILGSI